MGRLAKIWTAIKSFVFARYEAAVWRWGERSILNSSLQDARFDVDAATRKTLQEKHRYWVCNSPLVNRIRQLRIQFSVGVQGLQVTPNSSEESWNESRQVSWDAWSRRPELDSNHTLGQVCIQWGGALFDDGEFFIYKTNRNGKPAIQTFEAHRVSTPTDKRDDKSIIDGIRYEIFPDGGIGRPVSYFVSIQSQLQPVAGSPARGDSVQWVEIPAAQIKHVFKARRPGMLRGIPEGVSGMNTLHDYEDLHLMEMQAAKMCSSIGIVETNTTGELDPQMMRQIRMGIQTQNTAGAAVTKTANQYYTVTNGSQRIALKQGDSIKNFQIDRPSIATQQYWDLLISQICCSYNVPKLLVVPYSLQGTVTRADLDICANAFRESFEIIADALREIYEWQTTWAVKFDRSMDGAAPKDFLACVIRPPRAPNVDIGYTAQALQTELEMGTKTLQDVYAERQQDWRHQLRQIAETESFIDELAEEFGIDASRISMKAAQQVSPGDGESEPVTISKTEAANA